MSLDAAAYNEARLARIAAEAGKAPALSLSVPFFQSGTWIAPQDGIVEVRAMGAGGGGAKKTGTTAAVTGGYSGAWGARRDKVVKGQSIAINIGAGGIGATTFATSGGNGGATTIVIAGVTRTAPGGPGGIYAASGTPVVPDGPSLPVGDWDFGAASVKPGALATGTTGGAGVDILAQGNNATTSAATNLGSGGGTVYPGIGLIGGGAMPSGADANGRPPTSVPTYVDASAGEWIISFYGGSGGTNSGTEPSGNGGGGGGYGGSGQGGNGGGGGGLTSTAGGKAGIGGGGGGVQDGPSGGNGGNGYACLHFYPDTGV